MLDSSNRLDQIIEEAGKRRNIPNLHLDPEATTVVQFRGGVRLLFEHVYARCKPFFYTLLMPPPTDPRRRAAHAIPARSKANLLSLKTP